MNNEVIIQRIKDLIRELGVSQNEFADRIKTDRSNFSKHMNGKLPIGNVLINKILVSLDVSKDWLLEGVGNMFQSSFSENNVVTVSGKAIGELQQRGAPVYDIDVTAGPTGRELAFSRDSLIGSIDIPLISNRTKVVNVSGNSMEPVICNNDLIAIREITNFDLIFWGQIYVVILDDYRMVKYLRRHENTDMIILRSENKEYDDIEIRKIDIRRLFIVENIIRIDSRL
ncbi:XRE family transcriptional regulator [Coprobacter tertius]|uniref:Helix-turn-helix domain-containing protein n=1 Tax=Coprobacter tertius TaxID=2944915 RepID=A0ABT1MK68_9BACT|nr:S24 family peptidase [Coprobacter tertius]MCP9613039.1 helix-turn-helix domain-containing protein [Coprobacter tertius]